MRCPCFANHWGLRLCLAVSGFTIGCMHSLRTAVHDTALLRNVQKCANISSKMVRYKLGLTASLVASL